MKNQWLAFVFVLVVSSTCFADVNPQARLPELHRAIIAGNFARVVQLINGGADVNELDRKMGNAPLHIAAQAGTPAMIKLLIDNGAFVNLQTPKAGFTPLMVAVWYSKPANVRQLLTVEDININLTIPSGATAQQWIGGWDTDINGNEQQFIDELKQIFADYKAAQQKVLDEQPIIVCIADRSLSEREKTDRVKALIKKGFDVNVRQPVIGKGNDLHSALLIAARSGYTEIVRLLLTAGADQTLPGYLMNG